MTAPTINTGAWVIYYAMKDAGLLGRGQTPTTEDYEDGLARLNEMVNMWQTQGLKLFLNQDLPVVLTAGVGTYTLGPAGSTVMAKPTRVVDAYYSDQNGIRRPLIPLSWAEYIRLSQITQTGAVNSYFVDKQATQLSIALWLVPDATAALGRAHFLIQAQVPTFTTIATSSSFPAEWAIALRWGLADEICSGQPQAIMDRCERRAKSYRDALEDWDVEDAATRFAPDSRSVYSAGGFR
jgi:hypothetical protein